MANPQRALETAVAMTFIRSAAPCLWILLMLNAVLVSGEIPALAGDTVPFEELGGDDCFMFANLLSYKTEGDRTIELPLELVIDNERDYRKLFDPSMMRQSCADRDPSKLIVNVDFVKQTVLGLWSSGSCAATGFSKSVSRDDRQKSVRYSVAVIEAPQRCSGPALESLNLIAIPKLPTGYKVLFKNIRE